MLTSIYLHYTLGERRVKARSPLYYSYMERIGDLLGKYNPAAPDEVLAVKQYIAKEFGAPASVGLQGEALVITVRSAALANALRLRQTAIQTAAGTTKRLLFRIG